MLVNVGATSKAVAAQITAEALQKPGTGMSEAAYRQWKPYEFSKVHLFVRSLVGRSSVRSFLRSRVHAFVRLIVRTCRFYVETKRQIFWHQKTFGPLTPP